MPPAYRVSFNGLSWAQLQAISRSASLTGGGDDVLRAARQIGQLLETAPATQGDPMYRIPRLRLRVRHLTVPPLYVEYGVHDTEPVVFVRFVASFRGVAGG